MAKKKRAKAATCKKQTIVIRRKSGKVITEFVGRKGPGCGPRPKPKTGHLRQYKGLMKDAARACKGKPRRQFLGCVRSALTMN
jgi:hypothetical protein